MNKDAWRVRFAGLTPLTLAAAFVVLASRGVCAPPAGMGVGQEMKDIEKKIIQDSKPVPKTPDVKVDLSEPLTVERRVLNGEAVSNQVPKAAAPAVVSQPPKPAATPTPAPAAKPAAPAGVPVPAKPEVKPAAPAVPPAPKPEAMPAPAAAPSPAAVPTPVKKGGYSIKKLELRGDVDFLGAAGLLQKLRADVEGKVLTDREILDIARQYQKQLVQAGYYLAAISVPPMDYSKGTVVYDVDKGRVGKMRFLDPGAAPKGQKGKAFSGLFFGEPQIRRQMDKVKEGDTFDYSALYRALYSINMHPDLTIDTDLKVRKEQVQGRLQRFVDMDFTVRETLPVHAIFSFANSGTEATGDWRPSLTLQHLNLTKHDDVLTLNGGPMSLDVSDLRSGAASYYVPHYWRNGGGVTVFGGYSQLDTQDVVEGIDIKGKGWFLGSQGSYRLVTSPRHLLSLSAGLTMRYIQDQLILAEEHPGEGDYPLEPRDVTLVPLSVALSYSSGQADRLGGRNFLTLQTVAHSAGFLGSSDEEEIQSLRANADGTYFVERIQAARLQPVFPMGPGAEGTRPGGRWMLFAKLDGQIASGPLVPAEQKAVGGADTVRGFPERIVQGDDGISGTLELRTPLLSTFLGTPYKTAKEREQALAEGRTTDQLQFLVFADGGYVKIQDPLGVTDNYTVGSVGVGFRVGLTKHSQMKFDWGFPIVGRDELSDESVEEINSSGRYHFSAQIQF